MNRVYVEKVGLSNRAYYLVGLLIAPVFLFFIWGLYQQLVIDQTNSNHPTSDSVLIAIAIGILGLSLGMIWLMTTVRAEIRIADRQLTYRFPPFLNKSKTFSFEEIKEWNVVKKSFMSTGFGLRYDLSRGTMIYSAGTTHFLAIETSSGKKVMISTRNVDELKRIIKSSKEMDHE